MQVLRANDRDFAARLKAFVGGGEASPDANFQFRLELCFFIERADRLLGVQHLALVGALDVFGRDRAFLIDGDLERAGFVVEGLKFDFFEVENDIDDILDDTGKGAELVLGTLDFHGSDSGSLKGAEEDTPERVAYRVSVACLERLSDKERVFISGCFLILDERFRHFEPT